MTRRHAPSLEQVLATLPADVSATDPAGHELRNLLVVGRLLTGHAAF